MRRKIGLIALLASAAAVSVSPALAHDRDGNYNNGYTANYYNGYSTPYYNSYSQGYSNGYADGYANGYYPYTRAVPGGQSHRDSHSRERVQDRHDRGRRDRDDRR